MNLSASVPSFKIVMKTSEEVVRLFLVKYFLHFLNYLLLYHPRLRQNTKFSPVNCFGIILRELGDVLYI